jgi:CheY-like chemotaxis protein
LVVDDDRNHRHVMEELLADAGYEVEVAADGLEALAAIERMPPALLLLDLRMPNLDGFGVLERLGHMPRTFPIVVITALQDADADVIARGAASVIIKPVSLDTLLDTVQRLL